ncbi:heavy metal translocating P-type ATPase [Pseudolysinimonas sp.]|uniref:heavy metal translocating P-type ATPase n=1 Tax=Pseudolysinimonas sp. TaxID=2680009 RepID=UPI003783676B
MTTHDHDTHHHDTHDHHAEHGAEHGAHDHSHHGANFRLLFWICLGLTVPTLVFSTGLQEILGLPGPRFPGSEYISAAFGTAVFVLGGRVFLAGGWSELRARTPGMMTLISLALLVAFGYSLAVLLGFPGMDFWWELATLVTIMLLGHWIEMRAISGARDALGELAKLLPDEAELVHGDHVMTVPLANLAVGDRVLVRPGVRVPVDGEVVDGESELDESLLTGESAPVAAGIGSAVVAGSVNGAGSLTVQVTRLGDDTALAGISRLVAEAQASRSGAQLLADRAAALLFYVALAAAALTLVAWLFLKPDDPAFVVERVVTVLVIACPHALGLAIPLVLAITTSLGARRGILVRDRAALEDAKDVDVVLFDKTGTLTEGRLGLVAVTPAPGVDDAEALGLAAAVEAKSEHPIARALVTAARERGIKVARSAKFTSLAGRGAQASVGGRELRVGSSRVATEAGIHLDPVLVHAARDAQRDGSTVVHLLEGDRVLASFALADVIRAESAEAVAALQKRGVRVAMLTGDSHEVAHHVADRLGITEVFAEVLPAQKSATVEKLQEGGIHRVAMVGDGVNDAPALARADVGIAIGAGTDVAIESAGVVLASDDPRGVVDILTLSRAGYRKMLQNLAWAAGYNVVGLPLAAGVLAGVGFLMPPAVGAVVMSVSTIVVALNAQLLRRLRFRR